MKAQRGLLVELHCYTSPSTLFLFFIQRNLDYLSFTENSQSVLV